MKTAILSLIVFFSADAALATVITVSNNTNSPGQYTDLQLAFDAANTGDTIYLHASETPYGTATLTKQLVLIGEGAFTNKQLLYRTRISGLYLTANAGDTDNASGSEIHGVEISTFRLQYVSSMTPAIGVSDILITRCRLLLMIFDAAHDNITLKHNLIDEAIATSAGQGSMDNSLVANNIVRIFNLIPSGGSNNVVTNNIFQASFTIHGTTVANNIFCNYPGGDITVTTQNSIFTNNLFYAGTPVVSGNIITGSTTGSGNLFNVDPLYTTAGIVTDVLAYSYTSPASGPFLDFHLQAGSPGENYGTDGTDIGIYGGMDPWVDGEAMDSRFRYLLMSREVPHMTDMNILNPTIELNGTLNVEFNAKTQN